MERVDIPSQKPIDPKVKKFYEAGEKLKLAKSRLDQKSLDEKVAYFGHLWKIATIRANAWLLKKK
jgi:hypothetical protein